MPDRKTRIAPPWHFGQKPPVIDLGRDGADRYIEVCLPVEQAITEYTELHLYTRPDGGDVYEPANTCIVDRHTFLWRIDADDIQRGGAGDLMLWLTKGKDRAVVYRATYRIHSNE